MASAAPRVRLRVESDPWHVGVWRKSMVPTDLDDQLAALEIEPEHSGARLRTVTEPPSGEAPTTSSSSTLRRRPASVRTR